MLRWLDNLIKKEPEDYFKLGGPRSFHKFKYNNINIILIGEVHERMPTVLASQYADVMNRFIEHTNKIKIFLETTSTDEDGYSEKGIGFIGLMKTLKQSENTQIMNADQRRYEQGFVDFYLFLDKLAMFEGQILQAYHEKQKTPPEETPFFPELVGHVRSVPDLFHYDKDYKLSNLYELIYSQIETLDAMASKYLEESKLFGQFIAACLLDISRGLELIIQLEDEYRSMGYGDTEVNTYSVMDICIDMMEKTGTFKPAANWLQVISLYEEKFLDATLASNLWEEMKSLDSAKDKTIFVVTGDKHTQNIVNLMKLICESPISIYADSKGKIIPPDVLSEYLNDHFDHAPKDELCLMM